MTNMPSPKGDNGKGRDAAGRFAPGWKGGPGNPYAARVAKLRALILDAVTEGDLKAIVRVLVQQAKAGDIVAARELLNRLIGRPGPADDLEEADQQQAYHVVIPGVREEGE